ncbi:MAG: hypothetical protein IJR28_05835 [Ottowia sp.]|nr:hypothetical protein [Ottowia sp.]
MQKRTALFRPALLALCAACAAFSAFSSGHAAQAEKPPRAEAPEPTEHTQVNLPKSRCPNKLIRKGVFQGAYTGAECGDHCYALFRLSSGKTASLGCILEPEQLDQRYGGENRDKMRDIPYVTMQWWIPEADFCSHSPMCAEAPLAWLPGDMEKPAANADEAGKDEKAEPPHDGETASGEPQENPAVTRTPAEGGNTLVRGRGVSGLCPPGWSGKEDEEWFGLRFTPTGGKAYIMARALDFPMFDDAQRRLVVEWVKGMGAKNVRTPEGTVAFTDKKGKKVIITGHGKDLPAIWTEYKENPKAADKGVGFAMMMTGIRPDAESGARIDVPPYDGYPDDTSAEGDCWRVTSPVAALRSEPKADAKAWELLPKGSVGLWEEPEGKGDWLRVSQIDTRGNGLAWVSSMMHGGRGSYIRASDVKRTLCSPK